MGPEGPLFNGVYLQDLGVEILSFVQWIQLEEQEVEERQQLMARVRGIVARLWGHATLHVFGSSESDLSIPSSDVDFVVDNINFKQHNPKTYTKELSKALSSDGLDPYIVLSAKVPLVKFVDRTTRLCGDICFCMPNAVDSVALVRLFLQKFPVARPIIFLTKALLRQHKLNSVSNGGLSSYAVTLMVVAYLRISEHQQGQPYFDVEPLNVGNHFVQFLWFFGCHDLSCAFTPGEQQPICPVSTSTQANRIEVRDPLDYCNDVTKGCLHFPKIQSLFVETVHSLAAYNPSVHGPSMLLLMVNPNDYEFADRWTKTTYMTATAQPNWMVDDYEDQIPRPHKEIVVFADGSTEVLNHDNSVVVSSPWHLTCLR
jgi:DNA polymerase sigma